MEQVSNPQPHDYPAQYVLTNEETGTVVWFESYDSAVRYHALYGGHITNTATCQPQLIETTLRNARANMDKRHDEKAGQQE